jgi:hypothetical protein
MFSHYQAIDTSYAATLDLSKSDPRWVGHDIVNALSRKADKLAPRFSDDTADAGCTNLRPGNDTPRKQQVWDLHAEALTWNLLADHADLVAQALELARAGRPFEVRYDYDGYGRTDRDRTSIVVADAPARVAAIQLTPTQAYLLDDMAVAGSNSYHEALDAGLVLDDSNTLIIPPAAVEPLSLAIGIRADISDEGNYSIGERRSWLSLAAKVAKATASPTALPLGSAGNPLPAPAAPSQPQDVEEDDLSPAREDARLAHIIEVADEADAEAARIEEARHNVADVLTPGHLEARTAAPSTGYVVTCADGRIRHASLFATRAEADHWAEWGHACTNQHAVRIGTPTYHVEKNPLMGWVIVDEAGRIYGAYRRQGQATSELRWLHEGRLVAQVTGEGRGYLRPVEVAAAPAPTYRVVRYYSDSGAWHPAPGCATGLSRAEADAWIAAATDTYEYKVLEVRP